MSFHKNFQKNPFPYLIAGIVIAFIAGFGLASVRYTTELDQLSGNLGNIRGAQPITSKSQPITVPQAGITASLTGSNDEKIVLAGTQDLYLSEYRFRGSNEDMLITKLTVVNDMTGAFGDEVEATGAISSLRIDYKDVQGVRRTAGTTMVNGRATLNGLKLFVPARRAAELHLYADVTGMFAYGEGLSGQQFRLGLMNVNNSSGTFEAIPIKGRATLNELRVTNPKDAHSYVVRKSKPTFSKHPAAPTTLANGENTLLAFNIIADASGPVSFGRLTFDVETSGFDLSGFRLLRNGNNITNDVSIYLHDGTNLTHPNADPISGLNQIVVSFHNEESIPAGGLNSYFLQAAAWGPNIGDKLKTTLVVEDLAQVSGISGASTCGPTNDQRCSLGNGNTGRIYDSQPGESIFESENHFSFNPTHNMIWSDKSADIHSYPTISGGYVVEAGSGSYDWTNGYGLSSVNVSHRLSN